MLLGELPRALLHLAMELCRVAPRAVLAAGCTGCPWKGNLLRLESIFFCFVVVVVIADGIRPPVNCRFCPQVLIATFW